MKNNSEELIQYDGKHVRIIDDENETYEGIADVYFDEDGTDEYQLLLPHREYKNCLEEFSVERIKSIEILPD